MAGTSRKNRPKKTRKTSCAAYCFLLVGAAAILSAGTGFKTGAKLLSEIHFLPVRQIHIRGCAATDGEKLLNKTNIKRGTPILSINLQAESRRIERNPWIYKAVISRRLPGTIEVLIQERMAVGTVMLDEPYLIDRNGHIFHKAERYGNSLPVITGLTKQDFVQEKNKSNDSLKEALSLIACLDRHDMNSGSGTLITIDNTLGLTFCNRPDGIKICMGFHNYNDKLLFLHTILDDIDTKGIAAKAITIKSLKKAYVTL